MSAQNVNSLSAFVRSVGRFAQFANPSLKLRRVILGSNEEEEVIEEHRHVPEDDGPTENNNDNNNTAPPPSHHDGTSPLLESGRKSSDSHSHYHTDSSDVMDGASAAREEFAPLRSRLDTVALDRVEFMQRQREENRAQLNDSERQPLLIAKVQRDDGTVAKVIIGQSTLPQTIFNSAMCS
ncbi:vacuolar amino acid transporter 1 [Lecanosticta acicola]|uniref:Vacuolar amino acid transporter 1 n=1 Tax=Lecanosticta acicola TaxID=111012 RepID=A0AAI8Z7Z4_9PEZI|nr:vacuolar amino acid transporter 1 [Lecanosticta acicola]